LRDRAKPDDNARYLAQWQAEVRVVIEKSAHRHTWIASEIQNLFGYPLQSRIYLINAVGSGQHGYDGCNTQFGQPIRMSGVIGRQVDLEPGLDGRSDKAPVFDGDRIVAEDGLVGEGDCVLAGVGGDELV
jgi:hypothetical protein